MSNSSNNRTHYITHYKAKHHKAKHHKAKHLLMAICIVTGIYLPTGCGFKGPLYLPPQQQESAMATQKHNVPQVTESLNGSVANAGIAKTDNHSVHQ